MLSLKSFKIALFAILASALTLVIAACSVEESSSTSGSLSNAYGGPGSEWTTSFYDNGTFTITHAPTPGATTDMTVEGNWTTTSSGFRKLSVTSATGTNAPSAGAAAYGLEIPGFVFLLKPMDNNGQIIPMVASGSCPTTDFTNNWVVTNYGGTDAYSTSADIFGEAGYSQSSGTLTISSKYALNSYTSIAAGDAMTGTCSGGRMTISSGGNPNAYMWLSTSGAILVKTVGDNGVIVALPQAAYTAANLDGDYIGVLFNEGTGSGDSTFPVKLTIGSSGTTGAAYDFTDVDAGTTSSQVATISFTAHNDPANGFLKGTLNSKELICQVSENVSSSGKNLIFCTGVSPDDSTELFSVILVSQ